MTSWFAQNPNPNPTLFESAKWDTHVWGRQQFHRSFANSGVASVVFAHSKKDMLANPWRRSFRENDPRYIERLRRLEAVTTDPTARKSIQESIKKASSGKASVLSRVGGGVLGVGLTGYMVAAPALDQNKPQEMARAMTKGIVAQGGFVVGSKVGMGVGAVVGSYIPVVGTAIGAAAGWLVGGIIGSVAGENATDALTRIPDRMVDAERSRRKLEWGNNINAFQTNRAATMRQQSLMAMNRGQMSARSLMGQEATFVHK